MILFGKISEIGTDGRAKVDLIGEGLKTGWLHVLVAKSKHDKSGFPLDMNETVAILTDSECEDGVILGSIYTSTDKPELNGEQYGVLASNGDELSYDRDEQLMKIKIKMSELLMSDSNFALTVDSEAVSTDAMGAESGVKNGKVVLKGNEAIVNILTDLVSWLTTHTHLSASPGNPSSPSPQAAALSPISVRFTQSMES